MSFLKRFRGGFGSQRVLGLDIGSDGVRLALVRRDGSRVTLEWAEEVSLTSMQGFTDYEAVAEQLAPLLAERGLKNVEVAAGPPWNSARVVLEEMPEMSADRFYKAADWYFQQLDSEALLEPLHHAIPQPGRENSEGARVVDGLMVSMDGVMIRGLDEMCQKLDLRLTWMAAEPLCYAQILRGLELANRNVFVLDVGATQARLYLSAHGELLLVRKIKPNTNGILKELSEKYDLSWEQASQALLAHSGLGPLAGDDALRERTREFLDQQIERLTRQLADELQRSAAYVQARHQLDVESVVLCGGITGSPSFLAGLTEKLEMSLAPLATFDAVEGAPALDPAAGSRFAPALGAALQRLSAPREHNILMAGKIQLADSEGKDTRWDTAKRAALIAAAASVVVGVGGFEALMQSRHQKQQDRIARFQDALDEAHDFAEALGYDEQMFGLDDRIESLRDVYETRTLHTPYIARVVACLPRGTWLTELALEPGDGGAIEETSEAEELAEDFEAEDYDDDLDDILDEAYGDEDEEEMEAGLELRLTGRTQRVDAVGHLVLALEAEGLVSGVHSLRVEEEMLDEDETGDALRFYRFSLTGRPHLQSVQPSFDAEAAAR